MKTNKKIGKELERITKELIKDAKNVVEDYTVNSHLLSCSMTHVTYVHENSPALDTKKGSDEPLYSGSRWTRVMKTT